MTDDTINATITCGQCGSPLVGPEGKLQPEADDIVRCPVHGPVGRLEDVQREGARKAVEQLQKMLDDMAGGGFKLD